VLAHQLINQDSGEAEYYTPPEIIEAARATLGEIDLDPASSARANEAVRASRYFSETEDGLSLKWEGRIWLNHPFSRKGNSRWVNKLVGEYCAGRIEAACCITFAATSEQWFAPLMGFPQCYLRPRTNYLTPDGRTKRGVTKGSVVTLIGGPFYQRRFLEHFRRMGSIMIPAYKWGVETYDLMQGDRNG